MVTHTQLEAELDWTGERLVTQIDNDISTIEHLHRYALALEFVEEKYVLDIASGEGYGSNLLAQKAKRVIGVDISKEAVEFASQKYERSNLEFRYGTADRIPVEDKSVDIVVSFETLEHHHKHDEMMREIKRILKADGILIMSTPDKSIYEKRCPDNPFHLKEITFDEFKELINKYFSSSVFLDQRIIFGSLITARGSNSHNEIRNYSGQFEYVQKGLISSPKLKFINQAFFSICLSSDQDILFEASSFFDGGDIYEAIEENYNKQIQELQDRLKRYDSLILLRAFRKIRNLFL
jgi:ubiquinone/menaquinone biosynthesis C-methylase UbiE